MELPVLTQKDKFSAAQVSNLISIEIVNPILYDVQARDHLQRPRLFFYMYIKKP